MGRKKDKQDSPDTRAVEVERLDPDLQRVARHLGFRERASVNKLARGVEHERHGEYVSAAFAGVTGSIGLAAFAWSALGPREKRGQMVGVAIFIALWALLAFVYSLRARKRMHDFQKLEAVVKEKLGL